MRMIRYLFLAVLAICLVIAALANRAPVTVNLLPDELAVFAGVDPAATVPLFVVIFISMVAGVALGFFWEWLREYKFRAAATQERRERVRLEHEVKRLDPEAGRKGDDVLALLDNQKPARTG